MAGSKKNAINYTVEVVDKTGKAIHTSKTILGAIREARDAYKAKRAERKEQRDAEKAARRAIKERAYEEELREARRARREARRAIEDEGAEERRRERRERRERRMIEGGDGHTERGGDNISDTSSIYSAAIGNASTGQLTTRSVTDLALPPLPPRPEIDEEEDHVTALFTQVQDIIDHAAAAQSSVITLVDALRRDPETLAMVGITLAEISTVIAKLSPAALAGFKLSWPVVFSFLASPQFAIVAGVGIGTTIILLGGYKIIKKMIYGEPPKPPEIIDMGGTVVEEGEVRSITQAGEPTPAPKPTVAVPAPAPAPAPVTREITEITEITDRVEEVRIDEAARDRERERHRRARREVEEDPLAFGHSERRRNSHRDVGSRRSVDDVRRPSQSRSYTAPVNARSMGPPVPEKDEQPDVLPLAFDIPKKHREDKYREDKYREDKYREDKYREGKSSSSKSSRDRERERERERDRERDRDRDRDYHGKKSSSKREREAEDGSRSLILRRRK
ncbi:hypothetical protein H072_2255 [Dactylellina haptotyla CBS 200.50]|uniref:Uncharacterized protein n=1 Tax=Dactylellina haptotyla (strain CBS 200.50) TaxID=1284197 RepID=S8BW66_DACHA|nr:hypothetical protein H072_2255 [Dactylellina haptotyla CBS 200.50]